LRAFQNLDLSNCSRLQKLPTSIGQLNALQNFYLNDYSNLQKLITSIRKLNALQNFDLNNYSNLQELPTSIGQLITSKPLICYVVGTCKKYLCTLVHSMHSKPSFVEVFELAKITYISWGIEYMSKA
jgi:hypothetical protein